MTTFDLLKKMRGCNWSQLAKELGVSTRTLKTWRTLLEQGLPPGKTASAAQHALFHRIVAEHNGEWITIAHLNFENIHSIGGRK